MLNFPGLWRGIFTVCPWMVRKPPILPFWPKMPSLTLELSQKTPKNYGFEQFFKHSLNFEPLPPLISELNSKFDHAILCVLNWSLVSQNFVLKSYLYQKLWRKTFGGSRTPPPRSGRVNNSRTAWPITVIYISFSLILNALSYEINLFSRCSFPLSVSKHFLIRSLSIVFRTWFPTGLSTEF